MLLAAAISRFASLIDGLGQGWFGDAEFRKIVAADLSSARHRNHTSQLAWFATAYFHRPEEMAAEVREAGFIDVEICAIEGPVWSTASFREAWNDPAQRRDLLRFLALIERQPSLLARLAIWWLLRAIHDAAISSSREWFSPRVVAT